MPPTTRCRTLATTKQSKAPRRFDVDGAMSRGLLASPRAALSRNGSSCRSGNFSRSPGIARSLSLARGIQSESAPRKLFPRSVDRTGVGRQQQHLRRVDRRRGLILRTRCAAIGRLLASEIPKIRRTAVHCRRGSGSAIVAAGRLPDSYRIQKLLPCSSARITKAAASSQPLLQAAELRRDACHRAGPRIRSLRRPWIAAALDCGGPGSRGSEGLVRSPPSNDAQRARRPGAADRRPLEPASPNHAGRPLREP